MQGAPRRGLVLIGVLKLLKGGGLLSIGAALLVLPDHAASSVVVVAALRCRRAPLSPRSAVAQNAKRSHYSGSRRALSSIRQPSRQPTLSFASLVRWGKRAHAKHAEHG